MPGLGEEKGERGAERGAALPGPRIPPGRWGRGGRKSSVCVTGTRLEHHPPQPDRGGIASRPSDSGVSRLPQSQGIAHRDRKKRN